MFRIDDFVKPIPPKSAPPPAPKPTVQNQPAASVTSKKADIQNFGATNKAKLDKQYAANQPTPYQALPQIEALPKPDPKNPAAVKNYKEQSKKIADDAVKNSQPPKIEDFRKYGLDGATAYYEYQQSKDGYDSQVRDLKKNFRRCREIS